MTADVHAASRKHRKRTRKQRAWLNGTDVSNVCFYADAKRGIVRCFKHNGDGRPFVDPVSGDVAWHEQRGQVRIERMR